MTFKCWNLALASLSFLIEMVCQHTVMDKQASALTIWPSVWEPERGDGAETERKQREKFSHLNQGWKERNRGNEAMVIIKSQVILPLTASQLACNYSDSEAISQRNSCSKAVKALLQQAFFVLSVTDSCPQALLKSRVVFFLLFIYSKLLSNARLHICPAAKCQL